MATATAVASTSVQLARLTTRALFSLPPNPFRARNARPPPVSISMDPSLVDPAHLQALMLACAHSCAVPLAPAPAAAGAGAAGPEPVDLRKLRVALAHSFVVVSVFCSARFVPDAADADPGLRQQGDRRLVGFGRAVSDVGLTASVHDVVVHPSLQRRGIGRRILERITRVLHSRGIYDISALCTEKERPFFEACGFADDAMGSTTMMYTGNMSR